MKNLSNTYKQNGAMKPYRYTEGHSCHNCPYALQTNVPGCMFPASKGECFRYRYLERGKPEPDAQKQARQEAAQKIFDFIQVLKCVQKREGYYERSDIFNEGAERNTLSGFS